MAEYPLEEDFVKSQLAGGIMSAMIGFSREVHDRDLHSVNMEDRKIYFLRVYDFIVIIETLHQTNESMITGALEEITEKANLLLSDFPQDKLNTKSASVITNELALIFERYELIYNMGDMVDDIALPDAKLVNFNLIDEQSEKITDPIHMELDEFFSNTFLFGTSSKDFYLFILYLSRTKKAGLFLMTPKQQFDVAGILVEPNEFNTLVYMYEDFKTQISSMKTMMDRIDKFSLLKSLRDTVSVNKFEIPSTWYEYISITGLERLTNNPDMLVSAAITGYPIIVTGDRILVKIVVCSLSIFAQHKPSIVKRWSSIEMVNSFHILGTEELNEEFNEKFNGLIIDVNNGKITGDYEITGYFDKVKEMNLQGDSLVQKIHDDLTTAIKSSVRIATHIHTDEDEVNMDTHHKIQHLIRDRINPLIRSTNSN